MLCDECKRYEATYHSIKKINGVTTEKHLCANCQKKYGGFQSIKMSGLGDFFSGFAGFLEEPKHEELLCSKCGCSADEFLRTGFVGCSSCYKELSSVILPVIQKMQGDIQHVGKVPQGVSGESTEYERLKKELEKALKLEDYEQAMVIHARLKELERNFKS